MWAAATAAMRSQGDRAAERVQHGMMRSLQDCVLLLLLSLLLLKGVVLVQDDDQLNAQEPAA